MLGIEIGTPMYGGQCYGTFMNSVLELAKTLSARGIEWGATFVYNESLITRARNRVVDAFLKRTDKTHLLWCDADIGFFPDDIVGMLALEQDIVGAACPKKGLNWNRIQKTIKKLERELSPTELAAISGDLVVNFLDNKFEMKMDQALEVKRVGTGLMLVKREVFLRMKEAFPDRYYSAAGDPACLEGPIHGFFESRSNPETREYLSEDYAFCDDARSLGFKVWMAPWVRSTHTGSYQFEGNLPAIATIAGTF